MLLWVRAVEARAGKRQGDARERLSSKAMEWGPPLIGLPESASSSMSQILGGEIERVRLLYHLGNGIPGGLHKMSCDCQGEIGDSSLHLLRNSFSGSEGFLPAVQLKQIVNIDPTITMGHPTKVVACDDRVLYAAALSFTNDTPSAFVRASSAQLML